MTVREWVFTIVVTVILTASALLCAEAVQRVTAKPHIDWRMRAAAFVQGHCTEPVRVLSP